MSTRKILETTITEAQAVLDKATADLKALDKPKLRHGDYGIHSHSYPNPFVCSQSNIRNDLEYLNEYGLVEGLSLAKPKVLGNIFADLKAISEDLDRFSFDIHSYYYNSDDGMRHNPIHIAGNWHTVEEAEEISLKLRRVIATAKKKLK